MSKSEFIKKCITENKVFIFSKTYCPYCDKAKNALNSINVKYGLLELDEYILLFLEYLMVEKYKMN